MPRRHLGELEQTLLLALVQLGVGTNGRLISEFVRERTGRMLSPGAIYTALDRLEARGFVSSTLGDPTPERGGKRKRLYAIRPAGSAALRDMQAVLAQLARGLRPRLGRP